MKKLTIDIVRQQFGKILLSTEYVNSTTPLIWVCTQCGAKYELSYERMKYKTHKVCEQCTIRTVTNIAKARLSYTHKFVFDFVKNKGCELLTQYMGHYTSPLSIKCKCGSIFKRSFQVFKNSKSYFCSSCSKKLQWDTNAVSNLVKSKGGVLIGKYVPSQPITLRCPCSNQYTVRLSDFIRKANNAACPSCSHKAGSRKSSRKVTLQQVLSYVERNTNVSLVSTSFNTINDDLMFKCHCGELYLQSFAVFRSRKQHECNVCSLLHQHQLTKQQYDILQDSQKLKDLHICQKFNMNQIAEKIGVSLQTICNYFHKHGIHIHQFARSRHESDIVAELKRLVPDLDIETNTKRVISPYELDIYIPRYNLAIELNGIYWHSERSGSVDKWSHRKKMLLCREKNIKLITIFEDEWLEKKSIVLSTIVHNLKQTPTKVSARNTQVALLSQEQANCFLNQYHIQGACNMSIAYGLYHNNSLVACLTMLRNKQDGVWTLNRFATNCHVVGGFSKILKHVRSVIKWKIIDTFADERWSDGHLYQSNGFVLQKQIPPDYSYVKNGKRWHKSNFRHSSLKKKLQHYNELLSERENCFNHNYYRIWDCGKIKFVLTNPDDLDQYIKLVGDTS